MAVIDTHHLVYAKIKIGNVQTSRDFVDLCVETGM